MSNSTLKLCAIFHLNLAYSSIEEDKRLEVVRNCYWPLLRLARELKLSLGIEASGYTIETVAALDPDWLEELRSLTQDGPCEFIGSGYAQIIGPLVPARVNEWNQKLGIEIYEKYLGGRPEIALINEMAYSSGIVEHYLDNGYKAILMEWNNPRKYHPEWKNEYRYFPQLAVGADGRKITIIWVDSIAFQKFQRYAQEEIDLDGYIDYLEKHKKGSNRFFSIYANDVEIFDYRPERYRTEPDLNFDIEWKRIKELFIYLKNKKHFQVINPSEVLNGLDKSNDEGSIRLETAEQPIPVKKQEKYNINRWALTGRDDLGINTKCYNFYNYLSKTNNESPKDWKELCFLWSSDFRTHITEERWNNYLKRLNHFHNIWNEEKNFSSVEKRKQIIKTPYITDRLKCFEDERNLIVETDSVKCIFNKLRGLAISHFWFKSLSKEPLFGTLPHGYYEDISLGADFYSSHAIIEKPGEHKITDLMVCRPEIISNSDSLLTVSTEMRIRNTSFKKEYRISPEDECLEIWSEIFLQKRELGIIRPMNITFIPNSFDRKSLFYATHNGGKEIEKFYIRGNAIHHAQSVSSLISAKHGLGATEGKVIVGDREKHISICHDQTMASLIPSIHYMPFNNNQYFLRLQYSAQEIDETFIKSNKQEILEFNLKICAT